MSGAGVRDSPALFSEFPRLCRSPVLLAQSHPVQFDAPGGDDRVETDLGDGLGGLEGDCVFVPFSVELGLEVLAQFADKLGLLWRGPIHYAESLALRSHAEPQR